MHVATPTRPPTTTRPRFSFFAAAATALTLIASLLTPAALAAETAKLTVTVTYVDGSPAHDVTVKATDMTGIELIGEAEDSGPGVFTFDSLPTRTLWVAAVNPEDEGTLISREISLTPGDNTMSLTMADELADLTGVLKTPQPVRYYPSICATKDGYGQCTMPEWADDQTANFAFTNQNALPDGTYTLEYRFIGPFFDSEKDDSNVINFATITVKAGQILNETYSLMPTKRSYFFGIAKDHHGNAVKGATGKVRTAHGELPFTTGSFGQFFVHGKYFGHTWVDFDDPKLRPMGDSFWTQPGDFLMREISYANMPKTELTGSVLSYSGEQLAGAQVEACIQPHYIHREANDPDDHHHGPGSKMDEWGQHPPESCFSTTTDEWGSYSLEMPAGRDYDVRVTADGFEPYIDFLDNVNVDYNPFDFTLDAD